MNMSKKKSLSKERNEGVKCCAGCNRTKTPMWRCGPSGPKSLCNACGIKHNKKKNGMVGVTKGKDKRNNKISTTRSTTTGGGGGSGDGKKSKMNGNLSADLKVVVLKRRQRSPLKRRGRRSKKLGEVEQAAMILMALSLGFVFV